VTRGVSEHDVGSLIATRSETKKMKGRKNKNKHLWEMPSRVSVYFSDRNHDERQIKSQTQPVHRAVTCIHIHMSCRQREIVKYATIIQTVHVRDQKVESGCNRNKNNCRGRVLRADLCPEDG
jgi:hypothetical protein